LTLVLLALSLAPRPAHAGQPETAAAFLERLYRPYTKAWSPAFDAALKARGQVLTPELQALLDRSQEGAVARGDVPMPDGDLIVDAQEWKLEHLAIEVRATGPGQATGTVRFTNEGRERTIVITLVQRRGAWLIADLEYGEGQTLSGFLKYVLAEEQARAAGPQAPSGKPQPEAPPAAPN
jgi:hypothetical protein